MYSSRALNHWRRSQVFLGNVHTNSIERLVAVQVVDCRLVPRCST